MLVIKKNAQNLEKEKIAFSYAVLSSYWWISAYFHSTKNFSVANITNSIFSPILPLGTMLPRVKSSVVISKIYSFRYNTYNYFYVADELYPIISSFFLRFKCRLARASASLINFSTAGRTFLFCCLNFFRSSCPSKPCSIRSASICSENSPPVVWTALHRSSYGIASLFPTLTGKALYFPVSLQFLSAAMVFIIPPVNTAASSPGLRESAWSACSLGFFVRRHIHSVLCGYAFLSLTTRASKLRS